MSRHINILHLSLPCGFHGLLPQFVALVFASVWSVDVVAEATLKGFVLLNQLGGEPAVGVQVFAEGANPTVSDSAGRFELRFPRLQPGDFVRLRVARDGWVVVNDLQLERELPRDPDRRPIEILISKAQERERWAHHFYRLRGVEVAELAYERRLRALESAQTVSAEGREQLRRERDQALELADVLARQLAATKSGGQSLTYQNALRLFLDGRFDEALALLSGARLKIEAEQAERATELAMRSYLLRGQLLALMSEFTDAERAYDEAVRLAPQNYDAWEGYSYFHQALNHLARAEKGYRQALRLARRKNDRSGIASALNNLGNVLSMDGRHEEAREAFDEALVLHREVAKINPDAYLPNVAATLNNLGNLHTLQGRYAEARQAYDEALVLRRELAKTSSQAYLADVATTLNGLGNLHRSEGRYPEARRAYEESLEYRREFAKTNPEAYEPGIASTLNNLGLLHGGENHNAEARQAFEEALMLLRKAAQRNPEGYRANLAMALVNLAGLHNRENRHADALAAYEEALVQYRVLVSDSSEAYLPNIVTTLNNLGNTLRWENRNREAHSAFEEALTISRELAEANPETHPPLVAFTLVNLGVQHRDEASYGEARRALEEAFQIYEQLAESNAETYSRLAEHVQRQLAKLPR